MTERGSGEHGIIELDADVARGVVVGFPDVCRALEEQRGDFLALVVGLDPEEWRRPSRCHLWSVHDVVRHVRDASRVHTDLLRGRPTAFRPEDPFDNRDAPLRWLAASEGEEREDTVRDLERVTAAELAALTARAEQGDDATCVGPYGPAHWTVLTTHVFWDSWLHVRDITRPLGRPDRSTERQDAVAALYALLVASLPVAAVGDALDTTVRLTTASGSSFDARVEGAHVTLHPSEATNAADLTGDLGDVVDALAGRGRAVEAVLDGDPGRQEPFTRLRRFMTP